MVEGYLRQSAVAHLHLHARAANEPDVGNASVEMAERQFLGMINLRGQIRDPAFAPTVTKTLGFSLPDEVNMVTGNPDGIHILCLGPDEWLVVTPPNEEIRLHKKLINDLRELHAAITVTGESKTIIRLSGPRARDTLAKGCPLDLHPRAFGPGQCAQSLLARANMILHQVHADDAERSATYDIIIIRSFAEYIWTWLEDASQEYGLKVVNFVT